MKLYEAFGIVRGDVVAFIGAGGKTSTLIGLGYELSDLGWRVLATTMNDVAESQLELMPRALPASIGYDVISDALTDDHFVYLYDRIEQGRVYGLTSEQITKLLDSVDSDVMVVEADQAAGLLLKAAYPDEPHIPKETSLVVPVASLSALGAPLDSDHVYNVESVIARYGFHRGDRIKSPWIAQILRDEELGLRNVPNDVRVVAFLNRASRNGYGRARARMVARLALKHSQLRGVAIGSARGHDPIYEVRRPVGAVVLAAGLSTRMGEPKVLLPWSKKKTIIEHIIEQLIHARVEHIVVVAGQHSKKIKALLKPLEVDVVYNPSYKTGEMLSSLRVGLHALPDHVAASLVVLGDQPRIHPKVLYQISLAYAEGQEGIIAPVYKQERGHPVLIDKRFWPDIFNLPRGSAPRMMLEQNREHVHLLEVETDSVIRDVDTPEDYAQERWRAGHKE